MPTLEIRIIFDTNHKSIIPKHSLSNPHHTFQASDPIHRTAPHPTFTDTSASLYSYVSLLKTADKAMSSFPSLHVYLRRISPPSLPTSNPNPNPVINPNPTFEAKMDLHNIQSKALKCPRCDSFDTKFCYYNNYNYSQPRHFCKSCRRYWTIGGVLRNVPVGGGSRKSKNPKSKPPIVPSLNSESPSPSRSAVESSSRSEIGMLLGSSSDPLAVADWSGWIESGRAAVDGGDRRVEKRARGEIEGMVEVSNGVDGGSWLQFCGLNAPFHN